MRTILLPKAPQECTVALTEPATLLGRNEACAQKSLKHFSSLYLKTKYTCILIARERKFSSFSNRLDLRSPDSSCNTVQFSKQQFRGSLYCSRTLYNLGKKKKKKSVKLKISFTLKPTERLPRSRGPVQAMRTLPNNLNITQKQCRSTLAKLI